jgi:hypothetical protein
MLRLTKNKINMKLYNKIFQGFVAFLVFVALILPVIPISANISLSQSNNNVLKYTELKDDVQYFQTDFPVGLRYSEGWYGTFEQAPKAEILLFDDDKGICLFSMAKGISPRGEQGGTKLQSLDIKEAQKLIESYSLKESVEPYEKEITDILVSDDYYQGVWSGDKLKQKWNHPKNLDEEKQEINQKYEQIKQSLIKSDEVYIPKDNLSIEDLAKLSPQDLAIVEKKAELEKPLTETQVEAKSAFEAKREGQAKVDLLKYDPDRFWVGNTGNWSSTGHWSTSTGGDSGASVPTSADREYFDNLSFNTGSQIVTVDATANCLSMDWTGATNTPTLTLSGTYYLNIYASLTTISAMSMIGGSSYGIIFRGTGNFTSGGITYSSAISFNTNSNVTLQSDCVVNASISLNGNSIFNTNNKTLTLYTLYINDSTVKTLTLGSSVINCIAWNYSGSNLTLTANTSTINVSGTGAFAGGAITTYNNINLNGTAHTVSGVFTCAKLARNGTDAKTDTVTFTSGTTITCTDMDLKGNATHDYDRLLVQSTTLGTAATITCTNKPTISQADLMDITFTNAADYHTQTDVGDCGGNTGITFPAGAAQNYGGTASFSWSTTAAWTSRIPLPQDDVTFTGAVFSSARTVTVDMPRIGKSIDFSGMSWTGTATVVSLSNNISNYGDYICKGTATYTMGSKINYFRNRTSQNVTIAGVNAFTTIVGISATYGTFTVDRSQANKTLTITDGTTQTFNNFVCPVSGTNTLTIGKSSTGTAPIFAKSGGGTVLLDYIVVTNNTGSPASTWAYGTHGSGDAWSNANGWASGYAATITLSAATVGITTAILNGAITAVGAGNPTVTVYWGDNDGGQVVGNWDYSSSPTSPSQPQGAVSFYLDISGLIPGSTYYFSAKAVNVDGTSWPATSLSFNTLLQHVAVGIRNNVDIIVTPAGSGQLQVTWQAKQSSTFLVMAKRFKNPISPTDGYFVYMGTNNICTTPRESNTRFIVYYLDTNSTWILWANNNVYWNGVY